MESMICRRCLTAGEPRGIRHANRGDGGLFVAALLVGALGLLIWPLLLLAGLLAVLAVARMIAAQAKALTVERYVCGRCGEEELVPVDTPAGRQLAARAEDDDDDSAAG